MEKIFISYSWDNEEHKNKVLAFVDFLRRKGFNATCDEAQMEEETAIHLRKMMLANLRDSTKVIIVLSENYKKKADEFVGGVGIEYRYIIDDLEKNNNKYILVSFSGLNEKIISKITPDGFMGRMVIDLVIDQKHNFEKVFSKLMGERLIEMSPVAYEKPKIKKKIIPKFEEMNKKEISTSVIEIEDNSHEYKHIDMFSCSLVYHENYDDQSLQAIIGVEGSNKILNLLVDFQFHELFPSPPKYVGYAVKLNPVQDWSVFVNNQYFLCFQAHASEGIIGVQVEIKRMSSPPNVNSLEEIVKKNIALSNRMEWKYIPLTEYARESWDSIREICFVFKANHVPGIKGTVKISNLSLSKNLQD